MKHHKERSGLYYSVVVRVTNASSPSPGSSVRVKSKSLKKIKSRVRVESTTHTSQVRVESLLIHIEVESTTHTSRVPIDPHRVRVSTKAYMLLHFKKNITVVPQLIGVLMAAAMNYLFLTHSSAHNYCPVQLIITTQKCNSNVLYLHITMSYEYMVMSHGGSLVRLRSGPTQRASGPDTVRIADPFRQRGGFAVWVIYIVT